MPSFASYYYVSTVRVVECINCAYKVESRG